MEDLTGKRLLICEEALIDYKGHFYSWIKAIREIHIKEGVEVLVAGNNMIDPTIKEEFNVYPAYTHNNWSGIYDYRQSWLRYASVFLHNYRIYRQTRELLKTTGPVDCILLPAVRIHHLLAWKKLCKERMGKDFKRVILFLLTSEAIYNEDFSDFGFKTSSRFIGKILKGFMDEVKAGRVILAGDSQITCKEYERLSGVPFRVFPSPASGLQASLEMKATNHKKVEQDTTFVILGVSVIDKGIDVLQNAILQLLAESPELKAQFIIQWSTPTTDYDGRPVPISDKLRSAKQVQLLENVLDEESYKKYLQQADFIVLPYRRRVYFNRLSGVAIEAACAGLPMIVTENTWLAWALNEFGAGVTVKDGDSADLAQKIKYCIEHNSELGRAACERKQIALEVNSAQKYLEKVWQ
ncbi:glycosyltransferase [Flavitalea antarctica]